MDPQDLTFLKDRLIEANRALVMLALIDVKARDPSISELLRDSLFIYTELLRYQRTFALPDQESAPIQIAIDRLHVHLRFFGEDV